MHQLFYFLGWDPIQFLKQNSKANIDVTGNTW